MSANIPLEKLDNPQLTEFLTSNVKGGGQIPRSNWLCEHYAVKGKGKKKEYIAVYGNPSHSYGVPLATCDHSVTCHPTQANTSVPKAYLNQQVKHISSLSS